MILTLKMNGEGGTFADVDFLVPPIPGDIILRSDGETVRQRLRVVERRHIFTADGGEAACFIVVEPAP